MELDLLGQLPNQRGLTYLLEAMLTRQVLNMIAKQANLAPMYCSQAYEPLISNGPHHAS